MRQSPDDETRCQATQARVVDVISVDAQALGQARPNRQGHPDGQEQGEGVGLDRQRADLQDWKGPNWLRPPSWVDAPSICASSGPLNGPT